MTTYQEYEASVSDSQPEELYHLYTEVGEHWRLCTGDDSKDHVDGTYEPGVIERGKMQLTESAENNIFELTLPRDHELTNRLVDGPLDDRVYLIAYRYQHDEYAIFWRGCLVAVRFKENAVPIVRFEPASSSKTRKGYRRCHQRLCDHVLYAEGFGRCNVDESLYTIEGTLGSIDGCTLVADAFATKPDGWFVPGKITVGSAVRMVRSHSGNTIIISRTMRYAEAGDSFAITAGCDHTPTECEEKFDNKVNYGGNEFAPIENPFEGNISL